MDENPTGLYIIYMIHFDELNFQEWAPGPDPLGAVSQNMSKEDIAVGLAAVYAAWQKNIKEHIRVGCVLRIKCGNYVFIGPATVGCWQHGESGGHSHSDNTAEKAPWRTEDITGVAYPFEAEIVGESFQEPANSEILIDEMEYFNEMDGDYDSDLRDAGFGVNEYYGHFGDDGDW